MVVEGGRSSKSWFGWCPEAGLGGGMMEDSRGSYGSTPDRLVFGGGGVSFTSAGRLDRKEVTSARRIQGLHPSAVVVRVCVFVRGCRGGSRASAPKLRGRWVR